MISFFINVMIDFIHYYLYLFLLILHIIFLSFSDLVKSNTKNRLYVFVSFFVCSLNYNRDRYVHLIDF